MLQDVYFPNSPKPHYSQKLVLKDLHYMLLSLHMYSTILQAKCLQVYVT